MTVTAPCPVPLDEGELRARARRIRLVVTDCDGTLTDAGVYYSARGEELKRFSLRDGMGVELLARAGIPTVIVTREDSDIVRVRARKLKIEHAYLGVWDKAALLATIEAETGCSPRELAYIGDDVNDVEIMRAVTLAGAPGDAEPPALAVAHKVTRAHGGFGAFREFADWILASRA